MADAGNPKPPNGGIVVGGFSAVARAGSGFTVSKGPVSGKTFKKDGYKFLHEDLDVFRAKANRFTNQAIKGLIFRIQQAINQFDFAKPVSDADREDNEAALAALLRRQSILTGILTDRGHHTVNDSADLSKWLEGARSKKVF